MAERGCDEVALLELAEEERELNERVEALARAHEVVAEVQPDRQDERQTPS